MGKNKNGEGTTSDFIFQARLCQQSNIEKISNSNEKATQETIGEPRQRRKEVFLLQFWQSAFLAGGPSATR